MIWTPEAVEARLIEWAAVLRKLPDREMHWLYSSNTFWPEIKRDDLEVWVNALEKQGRHEDMEEPRVPATSAEIARYQEASQWFAYLPQVQDRKLVTAVVVWKMFNPHRVEVGWQSVRNNTKTYGDARRLRTTYKNSLEWIALALVCKDGVAQNKIYSTG